MKWYKKLFDIALHAAVFSAQLVVHRLCKRASKGADAPEPR